VHALVQDLPDTELCALGCTRDNCKYHCALLQAAAAAALGFGLLRYISTLDVDAAHPITVVLEDPSAPQPVSDRQMRSHTLVQYVT
jgi:hypothetical protein